MKRPAPRPPAVIPASSDEERARRRKASSIASVILEAESRAMRGAERARDVLELIAAGLPHGGTSADDLIAMLEDGADALRAAAATLRGDFPR